MYALYAFARHTDDLADNAHTAAVRRGALQQWRRALEMALTNPSSNLILRALADTVRRYDLPPRYLFEIIEGVTRDTTAVQLASFQELERYCYLVASSVGLACIHIWGFSAPRAIDRAIDCGMAFQLTNILRDLHEDAEQGRVYIPREDLDRYDVSVAQLRLGTPTRQLAALIRFETERAAQYYRQAAELSAWLHPEGWRVLRLMLRTYWHMLCKVRQRGPHIQDRSVRVGSLGRLAIAGSAFLPHRELSARYFTFSDGPPDIRVES